MHRVQWRDSLCRTAEHHALPWGVFLPHLPALILKVLISEPPLETGPMWVLMEQREAVEEGGEWAAMERTGGNAVWEITGPGMGEEAQAAEGWWVTVGAWLLLRGRLTCVT